MNNENATEQAMGSGAASSTGNTQQYLTFLLDTEEYGVDILRVQEIKGWDRVTHIPNTPEYVEGVMNLRGIIVPIIDLRKRFGLAEQKHGPLTVVIVLRVQSSKGDRVMGIVVDAVSEVYNIAADNLQPPPEFGNAVETEFITGLATVGDKMVIILDIDNLLNSGELNSLHTNSQKHLDSK